MNELILLSLTPSLLCWWWSDSCSRKPVLQDRTVQVSKTTTSASGPSSPLSCLTPKDTDELKALSWNAVSKTNSLLLQNLFCYLHQSKTQINPSFSVQHCWVPGSRQLQMTHGKGKTGQDQRSTKYSPLLLLFSCSSRTPACVSRKQTSWGISLLKIERQICAWRTVISSGESSPKSSTCSLPPCQCPLKMTNVNGTAHKTPMIKENPLSYSHQLVKTIRKMFPVWEAVARSSLSFLLPPHLLVGNGYFHSWDGWFTRKSSQLCGSTTASPLLWHCFCFSPCDNIVKLKQTYSQSRTWGQRTPRKSIRLCFNLSGQSHSTVVILFLLVRNRVCLKLHI